MQDSLATKGQGEAMLVGYINFMKYWAKNGEHDWIGNTREYQGDSAIAGDSGVKLIKNHWSNYNFWATYEGTQDALGLPIMSPTGKAIGW